jgi:imidazolonepropionase-like amidohydrolase
VADFLDGKRLAILLAAAALAAGLWPVAAQQRTASKLAIVGGQVFTVTRGTLAPGVVLVDGGKITDVRAGDRAPDGYEVIDARRQVVLPGLVDAHTHIGLQTPPRTPANYEMAENADPFTPAIRIADSIDVADPAIAVAREMGITTAMVLPGSSDLIGGLGLVLKTRAGPLARMLASDRPVLKMALGINPKSAFGTKGRSPKTRMATGAMIREEFARARRYRTDREKGRAQPDLSLDVLVKVLAGEIPVHIHAARADELMLAARIIEEFGLRGSIGHAYEGQLVAADLARRKIPVVVGPVLSGQQGGGGLPAPVDVTGTLARAGVQVSIMTDSYVSDLLLQAMYAIHLGLDEETALRAITINPAAVVGLAERIGSLEAGKDADLLILDGPPFRLGTRVVRVLIEGETVMCADGGPC